MRTIQVQELSFEAFQKFGTFAPLLDPFAAEAAGPKDAPAVFFRDMLQQDLGGKEASYSVCRVLKRPLLITDAEYHDFTCETAIPLDNDAILWFAPAAPGRDFPAEKAEAFYVPRGVAVNCRPGVWHHAPFAVNSQTLNVLVILPERTYARDTFCMSLPAPLQIRLKRGK